MSAYEILKKHAAVWIAMDSEGVKPPHIENFPGSNGGRLPRIVVADPYRKEILLELGFGRSSPYLSSNSYSPHLPKRDCRPVNFRKYPREWDFLKLCIGKLVDVVMSNRESTMSYPKNGTHNSDVYKHFVGRGGQLKLESHRVQFRGNVRLIVSHLDGDVLRLLAEEEPRGHHWQKRRIPWLLDTVRLSLHSGNKRRQSFNCVRDLLSDESNQDFLRLPVLKETFLLLPEDKKELFLDFLEAKLPNSWQKLMDALGGGAWRKYKREGAKGGRYFSMTATRKPRKNGCRVFRVFPFEMDMTLPDWLRDMIHELESQTGEEIREEVTA